MTKKPTKLTYRKFENATSMGAGLLVDFEGFRLIEGTDGNMKIRYLVLASKDGGAITEYDPDKVDCIEVGLEDFHQLCTYYLLSLQPDKGHAKKTLVDELNRLVKETRFRALRGE